MPMIGRGTYIREEIPFRHIRQLLNSTEVVVFATRRHWIIYIREVVFAVLGTIAAIVLTLLLPAEARVLGNVFFAGALYLYWRMFTSMWMWAHHWFIVTDTRVMVISGYFARQQAVMPIKKVTDFTYKRSFWGEILGYGRFVFESAGQNQALTQVPLIPHSDRLNRELSDELFGGGKIEGVKKRRITAHHKFVEYFLDFRNFFGAPFVWLAQVLGWGRNAEARQDEEEPFFEDVEPAADDTSDAAKSATAPVQPPDAADAVQPTSLAAPLPNDDRPTGPLTGIPPVTDFDPSAYKSRRPPLEALVRGGVAGESREATDRAGDWSGDQADASHGEVPREQWQSARVMDEHGNAVTAYKMPPGAMPAPRRSHTETFYRDENPPEWFPSAPVPTTYDPPGFDHVDDYELPEHWNDDADGPPSPPHVPDVDQPSSGYNRGYDLTDVSTWPPEYFLNEQSLNEQSLNEQGLRDRGTRE